METLVRREHPTRKFGTRLYGGISHEHRARVEAGIVRGRRPLQFTDERS
ncbi:MAG: hypothetical protein AVDCRST_MAG25-15 [uncultured Rubrobacteraceae bacterium]|uniref:Uncharacterized protein n=1 Tax=uncultured Rubrobacteraceae bacterium TaxID=349277 RepID=A0A6J4R412_9ACTN|nr:MAG: hypothetical protein AVDCRST_MAG25-15 [uncultured Rubrobacteraceae bacterium]